MNYLKKIYHRVNLFYIIVLFLISFSCENNLILHTENDNQNTVITTKPSGKYIDITGRFTTQEEKSSDVRNAIPTPGSNKNTIRYYAKAIPEEEGVEVVFGTVNVENKTFTITGIKLGITWTVEVGMEVRISAPDEREIWARAFYDVSESKKFTETDYVINKNFILQPDTSKTGSIDLDMILDSSIATVSISLSDENQKAKWEVALAKDANHIISTSKIKVSNIPSGSYELNISFYNVNGYYPVYTTTQTINVISGMVTDTWCSNGSALISSAGEFKLTSDIITSYIDSCIYVGQNAAATSIGVHASNLNEGRAYSPLATFSEAVNRITNFGAKKDYKIFISGNIQEFAALSLQKEKASSITIRGLNGLDENNFPKDSIDGGNKSSALSINAEAIPVNIINLQITGGSSSCLGIGSSSTVSLNGGVVIGNTAAEPETRTNVGIVNTGSLTINGAKILGNKTGISSYGENSCLEIAGATISNNSVAGITIGNDGEPPVTFKISGNVNMPYVPDDTETTENNIIDLRGGSFITVCDPISCDKPIVFSTSGTTLARGNPVVQADNVNIKDLTPYKDCFVPLQQGWNLRLSSDKKALSFDYPIYVAGRSTKYICSAFGSDEDSADGTSAAPFATIKKAIELINTLNDSNQNYTILIDGEILSTLNGSNPVGQDIGASNIDGEIRAHSLTIKGANDLDDNGNPKDIINGRVENVNRNARAITINTSVPITLECLKITGGLADNGGAISLDGFNGSVGNLTLSNDILITENKANATGGGLYIYTGSTLKVKGNVVIEGNTNNPDQNATAIPSNLYLQNGQKITVAGALTNGNKNARIGVSIANDPDPSEPVQITNNYSTYSSGQEPDTYFFGDKWNIKKVGTTEAHEVYLAATGGGISIAPNYENITIGINQTIASASAATKEFTFTASVEDDEGNTVDVEIGNGEGKVSITDMMVTYHGETVPETVPGSNPVIRYYTKGTSSITFNSSLPAGHYTITLSAVYNGRNYSTGFEVDILEVIDAENLTADLYAAFTEVSVSSAAGMDKISELCNAENTFENKTVKLESNISLSSDFTAISNFKGTFDGQKHTISGLSDQDALFEKLENGTIKRLTVAGSTKLAGIVITLKNGTVEDCVSSVTITSTSGIHVGGIASTIATSSTGTIRNCVFKGEINTRSNVTGGILGYVWGTSTCQIENCINKGSVDSSIWTGGIIGYAAGLRAGSYIRNCKNTGTISAANNNRGYGGIIGYASSSNLVIENCCNTGSVINETGTGIIACHGGNLHFNNNCNIGQAKYGILGPANQNAESISPVNNYSLSTVLSTGGAAWSTEIEGGATVDLSVITDSMIASFGDTEDEVNAVVNALNRWVNANGASVYAGWIKNADGKPELNLGDLDKL